MEAPKNNDYLGTPYCVVIVNGVVLKQGQLLVFELEPKVSSKIVLVL